MESLEGTREGEICGGGGAAEKETVGQDGWVTVTIKNLNLSSALSSAQ